MSVEMTKQNGARNGETTMTAKQIAETIPTSASVSGVVRHPKGGYSVVYAAPVYGGEIGEWEHTLLDVQVTKALASRIKGAHKAILVS